MRRFDEADLWAEFLCEPLVLVANAVRDHDDREFVAGIGRGAARHHAGIGDEPVVAGENESRLQSLSSVMPNGPVTPFSASEASCGATVKSGKPASAPSAAACSMPAKALAKMRRRSPSSRLPANAAW